MINELLILSTINYMATLYLRLPTNQKKIQKLMNISARSILKAPPRTHVVDLLRALLAECPKSLGISADMRPKKYSSRPDEGPHLLWRGFHPEESGAKETQGK